MNQSMFLAFILSFGLLQAVFAAPARKVVAATCPSGYIVFMGTGTGNANPLFGTCINCMHLAHLPHNQYAQCYQAGYRQN